MMFKMLSNAINNMNENELNSALEKAKKLLSEKDYNALLSIIEKKDKQ